ncbi:hypothetical protein JCM5353_005971 [Sporobolomyces roseus]
MFNALPPELVRQIIESTVPSTYQISTYEGRQTLLRSLCFVCRLFREIAQPLLFEVVRIDGQSKLIALHKTLQSDGCKGNIRQLIVEDEYENDWDADLERILRCQGLRSLALSCGYEKGPNLSVLQDLFHLVDLSLFRGHYQFPSSFRLHALTSLGIDFITLQAAPTLLDPVVLPSLRSLVLIRIYDNDDIAYLNRSRLADLVPQLEVLFLSGRIIQRGLGYLIPALSRTLFEFYPPASDDRIDILQVAQHLRIYKKLNSKDVIQKFVVSIKNRDRQISLRSIYLDISLEDLSSLPVDLVRAMQDLLQGCKVRRIEVVYEAQEVGLAGEVQLSSTTAATLLAPSPSTISFSSLPTELVRQIIESSVPSTFHSSTYGERQSTLCSLSLVSHRLQQIAQPLLREVVCFTTTRRVVANMELLNTGVFYDSAPSTSATPLVRSDKFDRVPTKGGSRNCIWASKVGERQALIEIMQIVGWPWGGFDRLITKTRHSLARQVLRLEQDQPAQQQQAHQRHQTYPQQQPPYHTTVSPYN